MPKENKNKNVGLIGGRNFSRAMFRPETLNDADRTIDVVFATPTPVRRYSWYDEQYYNEVLDMAGCNLDRAGDKGLPVLDNHSSWGGLNGIIGRAENLRREGESWIATVRFSEREELQPLIADIRNAIITDISFGYSVDDFQKLDKKDGEKHRTYKVTKWTPYEISFVVIPADPKAGTRSESDLDLPGMDAETREKPTENPNQNPTETQKTVTNTNTHKMKRETMIAYLGKRGISVASDATDEQVSAEFERALATDNTGDAEQIRKQVKDAETAAVTAERSRVSEITAAVRKAGLGQEFAEKLINEGTSIDAARAAIIDEFSAQDPNKGASGVRGVIVGGENQLKKREAIVASIELRANPNLQREMKPELVKDANEFRGMSLLRLAEDVLTSEGVNTRGMSKRELAMAALGLNSRTHSTSDFPIILGETVNKSLARAYAMVTPTFQPFCRRTSLADFKTITRATISGLIDKFDEIGEGEEYKATTVNEGKEQYKLAKYGRRIGVTWEMLINDDLDAFSRIPMAIATKAANKQSDIIYGILNDNPIMGDGVALFEENTHKNFIDTGTVLSEANLDIAFEKFYQQTGLEGDFIRVIPRFLIVGPKNAARAYKVTSSNYVPAEQSAVANPNYTGMSVIVDPLITDYRWFLSADPSQIDTIEYAFLDGEPELFVEQRTNFDTDSIDIKARMIFAGKAMDHRGMFRNDGAAS
jgi:hypothetical protein